MTINDQIEMHLKRAIEQLTSIDFDVKTDAIRPIDFQKQMGDAVSVLSQLATAVGKLNDQMRPLAQLSSLLITAEKMQTMAREALNAEYGYDQGKPLNERRFISLDKLTKGGE